MARLLYKVKKNHRWLKPPAASFLERDDVPADPIGELQTKDNALSVWEVEHDGSDILRVIRAIAGKAEPADASYILFDSNRLDESAINLQPTLGKTDDGGINHRHRDLVELSGRKLVAFALLLLRHGEDVETILEGELRESVVDAVQRGELPEHYRRRWQPKPKPAKPDNSKR
jgi:hypothetical protein